MALDCAGRQKEVVRRVMDKKEVVKEEKEKGKQEKGCTMGEQWLLKQFCLNHPVVQIQRPKWPNYK